MSDVHMYELEDIAWDELDQIDDHIVPHPSDEHKKEPAYQDDNYKKLRHEVVGISSDAGHRFATTYVNQEEDESIQHQKKRTKSSENESWAQSVEGDIPDSCDSIRVPGQCLNSSNIDTMGVEFCTDDAKAGEGCAANDTNSCAYSLGDMSQTENDLSFLDNNHENNESGDLLYYGWPDVENFDDVDRMLSCDLSFGFGSSNQDDLAWLSLSRNLESDFIPFQNVQEQDSSKLNNASSSTNLSNIGSSSISNKSGFQGSESGEADPLGNVTFMNGLTFPNKEGEFTPKNQQFSGDIHFNNSTAYHQSIGGNGQKNGKRKDRHKIRQVFAHPDHQKRRQNIAPNSFGYLQTPTPYMHLNYINPANQISGIKSEINSLASVSPRESSYASNQPWPMEGSHFYPFSAPIMSLDEKLEKLKRRQGFYHSSIAKQFNQPQNEVGNRRGVDRNSVKNAAGDYSSIPETSCTSSGFDETSLEASSFRQLQQVMEQLDTKTKLCIRDSLYRLARSAEQRHRYAYMKKGVQREGEAGNTLRANGSNNEFMDIETDTNPVDRSVAHLLFHRPSDPSAMPAHDGSSRKLKTVIHESMTSPPVVVKQPTRQEEAASEAAKKVL